MNRNDPYSVAIKQLLVVEDCGFDAASKLVGTVVEKQLIGEDDIKLDIEIIYDWQGDEKSKIKITCRVASVGCDTHEQLEESITLSGNV